MTVRALIGLIGMSIVLHACGEVSQSDDGATIKVGNSENYAEATNTKEGLALPDELPDDVPVYPDALVMMRSSAQGVGVLTLQSDASLGEVYSFYENRLRREGWETIQQTKTAQGSSIAAKKEMRNITVTVAPDNSGKISIIMNFR